MTNNSSVADDCEKLVQILADAPVEGLSQQELMDKTRWSSRTVNATLIALGDKVGHKKSRIKSVTAVRYSLKF